MTTDTSTRDFGDDDDFARRLVVELARLFKVSPPTIKRWINGESAPHPLAQEPVLRAISDAQAMALVKRFNLVVQWGHAEWMGSPDGVLPAYVTTRQGAPHAASTDLNRAIVECVAKMQEAKK